MSTIASVLAREILFDSRGRPTVEAELELSERHRGLGQRALGSLDRPPRGSRGRDGDAARYGGLGVLGAVGAVNSEIADALVGAEPEQREVDNALIALDGTPDKSRLGANAILAVSLATPGLRRRSAGCAVALAGQRRAGDASDADGQHRLGWSARRASARVPGLPGRPGGSRYLLRMRWRWWSPCTAPPANCWLSAG